MKSLCKQRFHWLKKFSAGGGRAEARKSQADRKLKTRRAKQQLKEQVQSHFSKNFYLKIKNEQNSKNNFP